MPPIMEGFVHDVVAHVDVKLGDGDRPTAFFAAFCRLPVHSSVTTGVVAHPICIQ